MQAVSLNKIDVDSLAVNTANNNKSQNNGELAVQSGELVAQSSELAADGGAETASEASTSQVSYSPT